jgi:hypothetical protein
MLRRLDNRIRQLCAKAVLTDDSAEQQKIFAQLKAAMHEHIKRLRRLAVNPRSQRRAG